MTLDPEQSRALALWLFTLPPDEKRAIVSREGYAEDPWGVLTQDERDRVVATMEEARSER